MERMLYRLYKIKKKKKLCGNDKFVLIMTRMIVVFIFLQLMISHICGHNSEFYFILIIFIIWLRSSNISDKKM